MKSPIPTLFLAILCLFSIAFGQERHNALAIDEKILEEAGPYYFIAYGDSSNAYARAVPFVEALGLDLTYDNDQKILRLDGYGINATLRATSNIADGLVKRSGVLSANGEDIPSPKAIVVDGTAYVAVAPVAKAFGAESVWHSQYRLITVNRPSAPSPGPNGASANGVREGAASSNSTDLAATGAIPPFRVGVHPDFTRVAVDLGQHHGYDVAVGETELVVTFSAQTANGQREDRDDAHIRSAYYAVHAGRPALVVEAVHRLSHSGAGFRVGETDGGTLYIDFAPELSGAPVAQLPSEWRSAGPTLAATGAQLQETALTPAQPSQSRPVVVLDAGHGGKFGGTGNGHWREEEIVLEVALKARDLLEAHGVDVILTREGDIHLSEDYRRDLSARADFATPERNLFVSIHANAADNRSAHGIETFVFGQPLHQSLIDHAIRENSGENRAQGVELTNEALQYANETSGLILRETQLNYSQRLAHAVQNNLVRATGATDRGVRQNVFWVLRNARTPAILVELGFLSNQSEGQKLASDWYQEVLAQALVEGILEFLSNGGTVAQY